MTLKTEELAQKLREARQAYYNTDAPIMNDAEFDKLEEELRDKDPQHPYFKEVGTMPLEDKIEHPVPLLSMDKAKSIERMDKWIERLDLPTETAYIIEPKIDGLSAAIRYQNGKLQYVATRGDGNVGQNITHIAAYMNDIPETISYEAEIEIRGELYLPKTSAFAGQDKPLRNMCVGLINRKEGREDLSHVRFVAFNVTGETKHMFENENIAFLKEMGFHCVETTVISSVKELEVYYQDYLDRLRAAWEYETDGLIICVNDGRLFDEIDSRWVVDRHHHYAIALKPPPMGRETTLNDIVWQVSRQGNLVPVALFEPVSIGGATLSRATLNNYENVVSLKLEKNDRLIIERANDVIPFVRENLDIENKQSEDITSFIPENCPVCEEALERSGVHIRCSNLKCPERVIQKLLYWVRKSDIENVAEATIRTLYEKRNVKSVKDLYELTPEDFEDLDGFAEKKIDNFISGLSASKQMTARAFIAKLGIPLVQQKSLIKLHIASIDDFLSFNDPSFVIGENIIYWKNEPDNMALFHELVDILDIENEETDEKKETVCMTGKGPKGRKDLIREIEEKGYAFQNSVTKDLDILICEDVTGKSGKLEKARKNGTRLISYDSFFG